MSQPQHTVINAKLRDDMMFLRGQLACLGFIPQCESHNQQLYDLFESVENQYKSILKQLLGDSFNE